MNARDEILGRIRKTSATAEGNRQRDYRAIVRGYNQHGQRSVAERLDLFTERLLDYGCGVHGCSADEIPTAIGHILRERNKTRLLLAPNIPGTWLPEGFEFIPGGGLSFAAIDEAGGVLTRCAQAIAETGTLVLRHTSDDGVRALSLIPDYYLCCVFEDQVDELVPEAIRRMCGSGDGLITTISGPSATSDIEMTRIKGVHGPRTLDVLLIGSQNA